MLKCWKPKNGKLSERGAVVIEATISLTTFLFVFMMLYSIVSICRAQARIQIAIDATAKEISQYSYLYGLTGLDTTLGKFQESGNKTKSALNSAIDGVAQTFEGIQQLGGQASDINVSSVDDVLSKWDEISTTVQDTSEKAASAKETIMNMAKDPQKLLLGMARLVGSEALELGKSRLIADPVCRALVEKHLKLSDSGSADAFCKSVGIQPATFLGKESYYNGLDFSNSTLFPYGSDEISIIVTYRVKLLPLLPIDKTFTITQRAVTKGWLHGDGSSTGVSPMERISSLRNANNGASIWNCSETSERVDLIRHQGVEDLKQKGYSGISGNNIVQCYDEKTNTFCTISSANPLAYADSVDEVNRAKIREDLERIAGNLESATDNTKTVNVKTSGTNGGVTTKDVACADREKHLKAIVVIPEDKGLKEVYEEVLRQMNTDVEFEIMPAYGTVYTEATPEKSSTNEEAGGQE